MELHGEVAVLELDALDLGETRDLHLGAVEQGDPVILANGRWAIRAGRLAFFFDFLDHDDSTADRSLGGRERDLRASQGIKDLGEVAASGCERGEGSVGPGLRVERHRDAHGLPALAVDDGQAFEQVVDLILADLDPQDVALDAALALEVADAVPVQEHACELEGLVARGRIPGRALGASRQGEGERQGKAWDRTHDAQGSSIAPRTGRRHSIILRRGE